MRVKLGCAIVGLAAAMGGLSAGPAWAQSGEITIWSWNIAASSLQAVADSEGFKSQYPDITVTVEDLGNQQVFDKSLAACAAGGEGLPDIVSIENFEAENYWTQFPDCFADLKGLGYTDEIAAKFPEFKRTELEMNGKVYAMPWDSGPVTMFYRRDFYEKAGVDPASIQTWDDFIAAGKKIAEANPGVIMSQGDFAGDSEWFRMLSNEEGCGYFSNDGQSITINQPTCVAALAKVKEMVDAGIIGSADWGGKIAANNAGTVATQIYGGWYEGTIRSESPDLSGKWCVYPMPSMTADGSHAANLGGSALAIAANSDNADAAWAFVNYALGTVDGQITMLKAYGLVPSLTAALDDPYVQQPQDYWGGQAVWVDILSTLPNIAPQRGTPFQGDAEGIYRAVQTKFLNGEYADAQAALDDAANQIAAATGLPIAQ